ITPEVRAHVKNILIDTVACGFAGHDGDETAQIRALSESIARSDESSVIGGGGLSLAGATLLNGYLITAVTMCDIHRPTHTHVTPEVVPPALAIAERDGLPGRDLLVALAVGFEITTRIGLGSDYPIFRKKGWHGPGIFGAFGAAAAVGRLLKLDAAAMARAFGLAGSQAAGTFAAWGTPTVKFHQCRGALSGLMASILAAQHFVATQEFLTASDGGLYNTYSDGGKPALALDGLGERWELLQIGLRPWPSGSPMQGINTVLFDLVENNAIDADAIVKARIRVSPSVFEMHGNFQHYHGKFEALISAHYTAAAILADRALGLRQYEASRYDDPVLRQAVMQQIEIAPDHSLHGVQAIAEIELNDGTKISGRCDHPRGSYENPLSRDQLRSKFETYVSRFKTADQLSEIFGMIDGLEDLDSVRRLTGMLRSQLERSAN
ncbi:MAG: MmgE/PrpD family protein, partial [Pseudorhodoplanes sp.]